AVLAHLDADMAEPVELRAGLTDLGGEELIVVNQLVGAERPARRTAGDAQREGTLTELGHSRFVDAADAIDLAVLDPLDGIEDLGRRDPIGSAGDVVLAPFGMRPERRGCLCHLLRMGRAGDQRTGSNRTADETGGQEVSTLLIDAR